MGRRDHPRCTDGNSIRVCQTSVGYDRRGAKGTKEARARMISNPLPPFGRPAYNKHMPQAQIVSFARLSLSFGSVVLAATAATPFQASFDSNTKQWEAVRGTATQDAQTQHAKHSSLRLEAEGESGAFVKSTPVSLTVGKRYELSGWVRTENLQVRDVDRSPIATGASIGMASMPFDVHSESLGGTRAWTRVNLRFTATRADDQVVLAVAEGGAFRGKAWFEGVSLEQVAQTGDLPQKATLRTFGPGYRYPRGGWLYVHIEGAPYERGYQHGYLLAP